MFGRAGTEATAFEANKQALLEAIGTTGLRIAIDLRKNIEMEGTIGAYAQVGANGNEIFYINADWINAGNLSLEQLTVVLLEECGHALDTRLNPSLESAGDEGELFANLITNATLGATSSAGTATILNNDFSGKLINSSTSKTAVNLIGAIHNAALISGDGNDTITGSSGDDLLRQGTGVDQLSGGAGNEVLEYTSISQSTRSTTTANTTQDYILNWNLSTSPSTRDRIKLPSQPTNLFNAGLIKASPILVLPSARALRTRTEPKPATSPWSAAMPCSSPTNEQR